MLAILINFLCVTLSTDVLFQAFNWDVLSNRGAHYNTINSQLSAIKQTGITMIWLPPPTISADQQGYMPTEWYTLVAQSTLQSLIKNIDSQGMMAIADVVLNHRAGNMGCKTWNRFVNPKWEEWAVVNDDWNCEGTSRYCDPSSCNCGNPDTGENACYTADVDHTNAQVQSDAKAWLNWLKGTIGYKGFRFDMVKGYAPTYVGQYVTASSPAFSVGEYWDGNTQLVLNWIAGTGYTSTAFDFPNRYALKWAIGTEDYNALCCPAGVMDKQRWFSVTFLDNHDTAREDRFGNWNWDHIRMGYAYILTHPGTPTVFWDDWNDPTTRTVITTLISIRQKQGITSGSSLYIDEHVRGLYAAHISNNLVMKLGTQSWSPGAGWTLATSGNNYAVWIR